MVLLGHQQIELDGYISSNVFLAFDDFLNFFGADSFIQNGRRNLTKSRGTSSVNDLYDKHVTIVDWMV